MTTKLKRMIVGTFLAAPLSAGICVAAESAEVEKFVKARIEVGEMMTSYLQGGERFKEGQGPSPEQMREMGADIHAKLNTLLAKYDLRVREYRTRGPEIFADQAAVKQYLDGHSELKQCYEDLPLDRMGRGGSGRGD